SLDDTMVGGSGDILSIDLMTGRSSRPAAGRFTLAELVQGRSETVGELLRRPRSPVMQEIDGRLRADHVLMNRHNVQPVRPESLENRRDFWREHRHIPSDLRVCVAAVERRPGIKPHARVYGGAHFLQL